MSFREIGKEIKARAMKVGIELGKKEVTKEITISLLKNEATDKLLKKSFHITDEE